MSQMLRIVVVQCHLLVLGTKTTKLFIQVHHPRLLLHYEVWCCTVYLLQHIFGWISTLISKLSAQCCDLLCKLQATVIEGDKN